MRKRRRPISDINVVPYLDVMLVLLVIFMITAPLFNQGVIETPKGGDEPLPAAKRAALEVIVEKTTTEKPYRLIDHINNTETARLSEDELIAELGKKHVLYEKPPIIISAEKTLPYEAVYGLLGRLSAEEYKEIGLGGRWGGN